MNDRDLAAFSARHEPPLTREEVRHGLILNNLARVRTEGRGDLAYWTLGAAGQCAIRLPPYSIVLGALDRDQCRELAEMTASTDYPGVIGPDDTAIWFAERATALGLHFDDSEPQQIYRLSDPPRYPGAPGHARPLASEDLPLFADWLIAFYREAVPHDIRPTPEEIVQIAGDGNFLLWVDAGRPVSMARIVRRLSYSAAITSVYTPPEWRGRGYAGSVAAALVERIFAEGRTAACLYTDTRNPASNRCYAKIGFRPVCRSMHIHRAPG